MDNYIFKKINEGFDREKRVLTFTDDNEHILNTSLDLKPTVGRIFSVDLNRYITTYSIFRRVKDTERNGDANPVLYALKGENDWEFSSLYNRNMFWERFKVLLKRFLDDHRNEFDTTIVIPSSNRLNSDFVKEIEKLAKEVGITHISNGGLQTVSTQKVEDAAFAKDSYFRKYWGEKWYEKFRLLQDYLDDMDKYNDGYFKYHMIDNKSGLRKSIINTMEVDTQHSLLYRKNINDKNVLLVDDSITFGQSIKNAIHALAEVYKPKSVSVLTMFSSLYDDSDNIYSDFNAIYA